MAVVTINANCESLFKGLEDNENPLVALEGFSPEEANVLIAFEGYRSRISRIGMCKEFYTDIERMRPGTLKRLDSRKLSTNCTGQGKELALEALGSFNLSKMLTGGLSSILNNFLEWLSQKLMGVTADTLGAQLNEVWTKGRRLADTIRDREFEVERRIIEMKRQGNFDSIMHAVTSRYKSGDDRRVTEILSALEDLAIKDKGGAVVPLTALANFCFINDAAVGDYRTVASRAMSYPLMKQYPQLTTGLMALQSGLPGAILIADYVGLNSTICNHISKIGNTYFSTTRDIARVPTQKADIARWLNKIDHSMTDLNRVKSQDRATATVIGKFTHDSGFVEGLSIYTRSTIGFWHGTRVTPQGDFVIDPYTCVDDVRRIFNMHNDRDLQSMADTIRDVHKVLANSLKELKSIDLNRIDLLVGKGNSDSARVREVIRLIRSDTVMLLRFIRILETYCTAHIRAYRFVRPCRTVFENAAGKFENVRFKTKP